MKRFSEKGEGQPLAEDSPLVVEEPSSYLFWIMGLPTKSD